jgi:hypothetical protein
LTAPCTYEFEAAVVRHFSAMSGAADGEVPLEFLFSGRVFYADGDRLRVGAIPWGTEAAFGLPVRAWHEVMDHHFPDSAWLRIDDARFDRLCAYKAGRSLATWDDVIDELLPGRGAR